MFYNLLSTKSPLITWPLIITWSILSIVLHQLFPAQDATFWTSPLGDNLLMHGLILLLAWYLNYQLIRYKILGLNHNAVLFLLNMVLSALPAQELTLQMLFAFLVIVHMSRIILSIFNTTDSTIPEFELGFWSALVFIIHPAFIFVIVYAYISTIISKANQWRDFMAILLGFVFGLSLKATYLLFSDELTAWEDIFFIEKGFKTWFTQFDLTFTLQILLGGFGIYIISYYRKQADKLNVKIRVCYWSWAWLAVLMTIGMNTITNVLTPTQFLIFSLIPILVVAQLFFSKVKLPWINDTIIGLLFIVTLLLRF